MERSRNGIAAFAEDMVSVRLVADGSPVPGARRSLVVANFVEEIDICLASIPHNTPFHEGPKYMQDYIRMRFDKLLPGATAELLEVRLKQQEAREEFYHAGRVPPSRR